MEDKNLELDRLVFFSDAVVAIAITLLALDLRLEHPAPAHLHLADVAAQWRNFAAFLLSFLNIALFWRTHHNFFAHIRRIDERLLWLNISWLLFIVLLPFSTTLVSSYFFERPAIIIYCANVLLIATFQNFIWDYVADRPAYLKPHTLNRLDTFQFRVYCNLEMLNAAVAIPVALLSPALAFILLFAKIPMIITTWLYYRRRIKRGRTRGLGEAAKG